MNLQVVDLRQTYDKLRKNLRKTYEIHKFLCQSALIGPQNAAEPLIIWPHYTSLLGHLEW